MQNSTLTSGTKNIYPNSIDVNDRRHRFRSGSPVTNYLALYFILSRDVPILKSFSAGRPKIFVCCSGGCSVVAAVAELSWPIFGCKKGRRKQRIAKAKQKLSK